MVSNRKLLELKQLVVFVLALLTVEVQDSDAEPISIAITCMALANVVRRHGLRNGDKDNINFKEGEKIFIERRCKSIFPPNFENCRNCLSVDPPTSVTCMAAASTCTHFTGLPICTFF